MIEKIDVIKLDVEGMERSVLEGAVETISRDRPIVFCECNSLSAGFEILEFCKARQYDTYGFLASAYNPSNFNRVKRKLFGDAKELALLLVPRERTARTLEAIVGVPLLPIHNLEDLVLPLLHKPQYAREVLAKTAPYSLLGINFPSPAIDELHHSTSWRMTAPLRLMASCFQSVRSAFSHSKKVAMSTSKR